MDWWPFFLAFMLVLVVLGAIATTLIEGTFGERWTLNLTQGCCAVVAAFFYTDWSEIPDHSSEFGPVWLSQTFILLGTALVIWCLVAVATVLAWGWVYVIRKQPVKDFDAREFRGVLTVSMIVVGVLAIII